MTRRFAAFILLALVAACGEEEHAAAPPAVTPTREASTYFGQMILLDHDGPKAQAILKDRPDVPLWFPSVRELVAYMRLPGEAEAAEVVASYVTDMAGATDWAGPSPMTWIPAGEAFYVIGSDARGGMGGPEAVPFSERAAAEAFAAERGGHVVTWEDIPSDFAHGPSDPIMQHHERNGGS